jgi:shikimate kinase
LSFRNISLGEIFKKKRHLKMANLEGEIFQRFQHESHTWSLGGGSMYRLIRPINFFLNSVNW